MQPSMAQGYPPSPYYPQPWGGAPAYSQGTPYPIHPAQLQPQYLHSFEDVEKPPVVNIRPLELLRTSLNRVQSRTGYIVSHSEDTVDEDTYVSEVLPTKGANIDEVIDMIKTEIIEVLGVNGLTDRFTLSILRDSAMASPTIRVVLVDTAV
jgi:hypothetical protein